MNDCPNGLRLSAYFDGELPAADAQSVADHLEACAPCQTEMAWMGRLSGGLMAFQSGALPDRALRRMQRAVAWQADAGLLRFARGVAAAAAIVVLSCSAWLVASAAAHPQMVHAPTALDQFESTGPQSVSDTSDAEEPDDAISEWVADDMGMPQEP
jgi:anti-sigma factor RsiW